MDSSYEILRAEVAALRTKALAHQFRLPKRTAEEHRAADVVRHLTAAADILRKLVGSGGNLIEHRG